MDVITQQLLPRRRGWHALTDQEKQLRLAELRRRQQARIRIEPRFLLRRG